MLNQQNVYIIAEAGVNHNGDINKAIEMIDAAADAGADCIKFQTFVPEALASASAAKAEYQKSSTGNDESQLQMLQQLALSFEQHHLLIEHCKKRSIDFLSSPFDHDSAVFLLEELKLPLIKLGSGELTNGPLLWQIAASGTPLILSTGMANKEEITEALGLLCLGYQGITPQKGEDFNASFNADLLQNKVTLLHCTTAYPCPLDSVDLLAMDTLAKQTLLPVGYSDHTQGINVSLAAVARGAKVIEKHFTLDRNLPGPDHAASLEPDELKQLVLGCRQIETALGSSTKKINSIEAANATVARKGLVANKVLKAGDVFSSSNLSSKRPQAGLSPMRYWDLLGTQADRNYSPDEAISQDEY